MDGAEKTTSARHSVIDRKEVEREFGPIVIARLDRLIDTPRDDSRRRLATGRCAAGDCAAVGRRRWRLCVVSVGNVENAESSRSMGRPGCVGDSGDEALLRVTVPMTRRRECGPVRQGFKGGRFKLSSPSDAFRSTVATVLQLLEDR